MDVDVVIAGGGPAGLLLASYIDQALTVAIVEQASVGETQKYWSTTPDRLRRHNLECAIVERTGTVSVGTYLGGLAVAQGEIAIVDEKRLLRELWQRCADRGVQMLERTTIQSISWPAGRVHVGTTGGSISARLVVDCMGGASLLASTFRLHRLDGFFSIIGGHYTGIQWRQREVALAHALRLGDPPVLFEVIPTGAASCIAAVFVMTPRLLPSSHLRDSLADHVASNPFFAVTPSTGKSTAKVGVIPIGRRRRRELPGIVAFGEAALMQPPLLGSAFTEVLEYVERAAEQLNRACTRQRGVVQYRVRYPLRKRLNDYVQRHVLKHVLGGGITAFDRVTRSVARLAPETQFRLYSNLLELSDLASVLSLLLRASAHATTP